MTDRHDRWALWVARGYALVQALAALFLLYLIVRAGISLHALAQNIAALPAGDATTPYQSAIATLGLVLNAVTGLGMFSISVTFLFLASGLWRMREWARHGLLVVAIASMPVFIAMPAVNWLIGIARAGSTGSSGLPYFSIPVAIGGIVLAALTVYLFAYRPEIISLYTPRPHLTRSGTSKYAYTQTPIPAPAKRK